MAPRTMDDVAEYLDRCRSELTDWDELEDELACAESSARAEYEARKAAGAPHGSERRAVCEAQPSTFERLCKSMVAAGDWDGLEARLLRETVDGDDTSWYDRPCPMLDAAAKRTPEELEASKAAWDREAERIRQRMLRGK